MTYRNNLLYYPPIQKIKPDRREERERDMENHDGQSIKEIISNAKKYIEPHEVPRLEAEEIYADLAPYATTMETYLNILDSKLADTKYHLVGFVHPSEGSEIHRAANAYAGIKELRFVNLVHNALCEQKNRMTPQDMDGLDRMMLEYQESLEDLELSDDDQEQNLTEEQEQQEEEKQEILSFLNEEEPAARKRYHHIFNWIAVNNEYHENLKSRYSLYMPKNTAYIEPSVSSDTQYQSIEDYMTGNYELAACYEYQAVIFRDDNDSKEENNDAMQQFREALKKVAEEEKLAAKNPIHVPKPEGPERN